MLSTGSVCAVYTFLLCWPSMYRLYLPASTGTLFYYVVAYLVPLVAGLLLLPCTGKVLKRALILLSVGFVLLLSIVFSLEGCQRVEPVFFAVKFYLTPITLLWLGFHFGERLGPECIGRLMMVIVFGHLLFSLGYYYNVFSNPVYSGEGGFSENWTTTVGTLRAFLGLTLSKFDLAYQLGFAVIAMLLMGDLFYSRARYWLTILGAGIVIVFTYNKTVYLLVGLTLMAIIYRRMEARARAFAVATMGVGLGAAGYIITLFLRGELPLRDLFIFMSPQTFWSRVGIWATLPSFHWPNAFFGLGAGSLVMADQTVDNQFLFTYLEMGALGALAYFGLLLASFRHVASESPNLRMLLLLLGIASLIGDTLHALTVMYIVGMFLGAETYAAKRLHRPALVCNFDLPIQDNEGGRN